jgi:hypothetical protein
MYKPVDIQVVKEDMQIIRRVKFNVRNLQESAFVSAYTCTLHEVALQCTGREFLHTYIRTVTWTHRTKKQILRENL